MKFPAATFERFCSKLIIDSKEDGLIPLRFLGTQRHVIDQITKGLEEGVNNFTILKCRQAGISTVTLGLDLFWAMTHPGTQGAIVTDTDENRDYFRSIIKDYHKHLPPSLKVPMQSFNRAQAQFSVRSRLLFMAAGSRRSGNLGRAKGVNFLHATECSSWVDEEGLESLRSSLAENNPNRLYIWESTARGFNLFYNMWEDAKRAKTQRAIFVGWWMNGKYAVPEGSRLFEAYKGKPVGDERDMVRRVKLQYGHEMTQEQLAWWRWKGAEVIGSTEALMQEFPPTEEDAFISTGSHFFGNTPITDAWVKAKMTKPELYRYEYGQNFDETRIEACTESLAELKVWQHPQANGHYVIGADPAYGSSGDSDRFAVQVLRCWADRVEQVAEYCTTRGSVYSFAWVVAHLAGAYHGALILEINGPGMAVWAEMQRMMQGLSSPGAERSQTLMNVMNNIQHYLYTRPDSLRGGSGVFHWKTTNESKEWIMNQFRDGMERARMNINSVELLEEMRYVTVQGGYIGSGKSGVHDDLVMAMALAYEAYNKSMLPQLAANRVLYDDPNKPGGQGDPTVLDRNLSQFLDRLGIA
jgi:hypothetical protein